MHVVSLDLDVIQEPNPEYFVPLMGDASTAVKFGFTEMGNYWDFPSLCSACDVYGLMQLPLPRGLSFPYSRLEEDKM